MKRGHLSGRSRFPFTIASIMDGWSEPTLTKHAVMPDSHSASINANAVVYLVGGAEAMDADVRRAAADPREPRKGTHDALGKALLLNDRMFRSFLLSCIAWEYASRSAMVG